MVYGVERLAAPEEGGSGPLNRLTERELEVLALLASGKSNKEIGQALKITADGAKAHVSRILHKLGVSSRTEAAVLWTRTLPHTSD